MKDESNRRMVASEQVYLIPEKMSFSSIRKPNAVVS